MRPKTLVFISVATPDRHRDEIQRQGSTQLSDSLFLCFCEFSVRGGAYVDDGFPGLPAEFLFDSSCDTVSLVTAHTQPIVPLTESVCKYT